MPKKYAPFNLMRETDARERLTRRGTITYGPVGPPPKHLSEDDRVAWLDLTDAAAPGVLQRSDKLYLELTASLLAQARRGELNKSAMKELGKCLRKMFLTPAKDGSVEQQRRGVLDAFKGNGPVN